MNEKFKTLIVVMVFLDMSVKWENILFSEANRKLLFRGLLEQERWELKIGLFKFGNVISRGIH